jgi:phenylalanyl-tRNA synthetase alpha chain
LKNFFELKILRFGFRPSFFPFTELSAEVNVNYEIPDGKIVFGVGDKWLEICGCGATHPNIPKSAI